MPVLCDTNILLRLTQKHHPHSLTTVRALNRLELRDEALHITHQSIVEFWAVATRPTSVNGLGLSIRQTLSEIDRLKFLFPLLPELPLHTTWEKVVLKYGVSGRNVHDARIVAAMIVHGVDKILTFNVQDFTRYTEISALDPAQIS